MIREPVDDRVAYQKISKHSIVLWELLFFIGWVILLSAILWVFMPIPWLWHLLIFSMGVFLLLTEFLYLPSLYRSIGYCINDRALIYRHGVFFQKQKLIYRDRIVYVSVYHTPITSILGISALVVATPGAKLRIPFLNYKVAKSLAKQLSPSPKEIY